MKPTVVTFNAKRLHDLATEMRDIRCARSLKVRHLGELLFSEQPDVSTRTPHCRRPLPLACMGGRPSIIAGNVIYTSCMTTPPAGFSCALGCVCFFPKNTSENAILLSWRGSAFSACLRFALTLLKPAAIIRTFSHCFAQSFRVVSFHTIAPVRVQTAMPLLLHRRCISSLPLLEIDAPNARQHCKTEKLKLVYTLNSNLPLPCERQNAFKGLPQLIHTSRHLLCKQPRRAWMAKTRMARRRKQMTNMFMDLCSAPNLNLGMCAMKESRLFFNQRTPMCLAMYPRTSCKLLSRLRDRRHRRRLKMTNIFPSLRERRHCPWQTARAPLVKRLVRRVKHRRPWYVAIDATSLLP